MELKCARCSAEACRTDPKAANYPAHCPMTSEPAAVAEALAELSALQGDEDETCR